MKKVLIIIFFIPSMAFTQWSKQLAKDINAKAINEAQQYSKITVDTFTITYKSITYDKKRR